jgi:hypothetical protein
MFDHPAAFLPDEGAQDGGRHLVVVLRRETIAHVIDQGRDDPVNIRTFTFGAGGGLQSVIEAGNFVAFDRFVTLAGEFGEDKARRAFHIICFELVEEQVSSIVASFICVNATVSICISI